ncbi:NAD(P)-binding protein [Mycena rosella]|uniref:NAD(P)-binding protein n=1 Tax=Mycena rosella TaxID=1033263 RepID=A0AAD7DVW2_MYCRO|nr:NAD(P)-binding protein [Mycena rosella]
MFMDPQSVLPATVLLTGIMSSKGIALVTGAAQGIGRTIALRLADDGFNVAVNDIPSKTTSLAQVVEDIQAKGRASSAHLADVTSEEQVEKMVADVAAAHGGIDVMVANAGVAKWARIVDTSTDEWDRIMTINGRGTFLSYKYAGMQMIKQGRGGRIIGASSAAGKAGYAGLGAYCASKFAVRGLTQAAGTHGITVNAYAPGSLDSEMMNGLAVGNHKDTGIPPEVWLDGLKSATPLKRLGTMEDVANLVSFIASEGSGFITGQSLSVNGGTYFD